ncbi:response regulator transcription factor [uncultured Serinicoccus sp.]|uniref:response regulator transcription factor n=1 Tax=uncultured Serinicoccus sp. TaxID=735514 RepID=UPI00262266A7|nr:response regulator transcription factor [uncultured Serinicoccus sp.]
MVGTEPLRVALMNDFEVVVRGLQAMLEPFEHRVSVVEIGAQSEVEQSVDVTLYDTFSEPQVDGDDFDEVLESDDPGAVVVYTWNVDPALVEIALAKGCRGYIGKTVSGAELVECLERVASGEVVVEPATSRVPAPEPHSPGDWPGRVEGLSAREAEIVTLITQGLTNNDIALRTYLSINSVKTYIRTAYRKMGVTRRSQAVRWGLEHGLTPDTMRRDVEDESSSQTGA